MQDDGYVKKRKKSKSKLRERVERISIITQKLFNYLFIAMNINELESLLLLAYECGHKNPNLIDVI